jgi:hypothetical protein
MNHLTKHPLKFLAILLFATVFISCKKDKDDDDGSPSSYPKDVTIEYRITTPTSAIKNADVTYTNETGGLSNLDAAALPFSKKFTRKVNRYDNVALSVTSTIGGSIKTEILVNDKVVTTQTFTGTSIVHGVVPHIFN